MRFYELPKGALFVEVGCSLLKYKNGDEIYRNVYATSEGFSTSSSKIAINPDVVVQLINIRSTLRVDGRIVVPPDCVLA